MNHFLKYRMAALVIFFSGFMALPPGHAQIGGNPPRFQFTQTTIGGYLGIQMEDVTAANVSKYKLSSERGVIVRSVAKGSPAEAASIKENDVILEYGGFPVWSATQFTRLVQETPAGRTVDLAISRDGKRSNLIAKIEDREVKRAESPMEFPGDLFGPGMRSFQFRMPTPENDRSSEAEAPKPRLGITLQPLTDQMGEFLGVPKKKGALVVAVAADSISAGKLKSGDVIIGANSATINSPEDLTQFISTVTDGAVTLKIVRDKKETTVVVNLPADDSKKGFKL
jgi:serine protease Do